MKQVLIILLIIVSNTSLGQHIGVRYSTQSKGISMSVPVGTLSKGSIMATFAGEGDRRLAYFHYTEKLKITKNLYGFGGAGIHMGAREVLSFKRDANTIFLAGFTGVLGVKYNVKETFYIAADVMPRTDIPLFGGCEEHKYCNESSFGSINFSIGINLK
jgi:hypothetical protein